MKKIIFLIIIISFNISLADCKTYQLRCECVPAVPFEGFQINVVEICDGQESSWKYYNLSQFDTLAECNKAIEKNKNCNRLN